MADLISISVKGDEQTLHVLDAAKRATNTSTPTFSQIGKYLTGFFSGEVFASRGRVIGEPWPKLNAAYAAWKAKHYPGRPPMVRSGKLQGNYRYQANPRFVRLYNPTKYFRYHQLGEGVPQRVTMKVDHERKVEIATIIAERIKQEIIRAS